MKILGHLHTFNDDDVIDRSLQALLDQTIPLDAIGLVDNGSTDGTLNRPFPAVVTVLRHTENLGTSGAVISGMRYALEHGFTWIWTFDADSAPKPDALEKLLSFYAGLAKERQDRIQFLSSVTPLDAPEVHGVTFSTRGYDPVKLDLGQEAIECAATMWSGSLFKVDTIRAIGLPPADYVLDCGEFAYGYHGMRKGYKSYVIPSSRFAHNIGGQTSLQVTTVRFGPLSFRVMAFPPIRLYYLFRNNIYFWFYEYHQAAWSLRLRLLLSWRHALVYWLLGRWAEGAACFRALIDGFFRRMHRRY